MQKRQELETYFDEILSTNSLTTSTLNEFRQTVFNSFNDNEITIKDKQELLINLYLKADENNLFYMRITDKKVMPEDQKRYEDQQDEDDESSYSEEEDESYS